MRITLGVAVELVALLGIGGGQQWVGIVAAAVEKIEAAVHDVRSGLERMTGVNPDIRVDAAGVGAVLDVGQVIWTILLVQVAERVEELVVDSAASDAPVGKSERLPAGMDVRLAVGAAGADSDVGPAAGTAGSLAGDVDTDVVAEVGIVDELETAHGQGEVGKLVLDLLPVLGGNSVLDGVRDDVFTIGKFAARIMITGFETGFSVQNQDGSLDRVL